MSGGPYPGRSASPAPGRMRRLNPMQFSALAFVLPELPESRLSPAVRTCGLTRVVYALRLRLLDGLLVPANRVHHSSLSRGADETTLTGLRTAPGRTVRGNPSIGLVLFNLIRRLGQPKGAFTNP